MGYMKRQAEAEADTREEVLSFLLEIGTLKECDDHPGTYYDGDGDLEAAYRRANAAITSGKIVLGGETRRTFTDRLKAVYEDNSGIDGCPCCERNFRDD